LDEDVEAYHVQHHETRRRERRIFAKVVMVDQKKSLLVPPQGGGARFIDKDGMMQRDEGGIGKVEHEQDD